MGTAEWTLEFFPALNHGTAARDQPSPKKRVIPSTARDLQFLLAPIPRPRGALTRLLAVRRRSSLRLKHGHVLHVNSSLGDLVQPAIRLVVKILRQVLRRGIDHLERLNIVDHL